MTNRRVIKEGIKVEPLPCLYVMSSTFVKYDIFSKIIKCISPIFSYLLIYEFINNMFYKRVILWKQGLPQRTENCRVHKFSGPKSPLNSGSYRPRSRGVVQIQSSSNKTARMMTKIARLFMFS